MLSKEIARINYMNSQSVSEKVIKSVTTTQNHSQGAFDQDIKNET